MSALDLGRIRDAECVVGACLPETPLLPLGFRTTRRGQPILLKAESLQPTSSFKIRGAIYRVANLSAHERAAGVVGYSGGNHASALAWAARAAGIDATVVMSHDAAPSAIEAARRFGATVVMADPTPEARRVLAEALAIARQAPLVPPCDHIDVMAGQATVATEVLRHGPMPVIYVPVGGGGLIAGIAAAVKLLCPDTWVIGVEPELKRAVTRRVRAGRVERVRDARTSLAEGIATVEPSELTWPLIERYVDDIVTVSDAEIADACRTAAELAHVVLEPAGAAALAAALEHRAPGRGPVVAVASGGNVEWERFVSIAAAR